MENQSIQYYVDVNTGVLKRESELQKENLMLESDEDASVNINDQMKILPEWNSADGFYLMEQFVMQLKNPVARLALQEVLLSGNRVFRNFKDCLKEYVEVSRQYYAFKYAKMRAAVINWYNSLRELSGLEAIEDIPDEETKDVLHIDVDCRKLEEMDCQLLQEFDDKAFQETMSRIPTELFQYYLQMRRRRLVCTENTMAYGAYTHEEELCGILWAEKRDIGSTHQLIVIEQLYVVPEYRGFGIGQLLFDFTISSIHEMGMQWIQLAVPGYCEAISRIVKRAESIIETPQVHHSSVLIMA
jgi:GNAT superfamily N-acetyltransferase